MVKFFYVLGLLIMVLSGGCSILLIGSESLSIDVFVIVGMVGGIPFLAGVTMFVLARNDLKKRDR